MNVYVDSSVLLRVVLGEPRRLRSWSRITTAISSELIRLECLRTIDRARIRLALADEEIAERREAVLDALDAFTLAPLERPVLERAADPFPTLIGSLDAIHLATALLVRKGVSDLILGTHDERLATAARALGFRVAGAE